VNRSEKLLLFSALAFALAFAAVSLSEGARLLARPGDAGASPLVGEPRDVDMEKLRRLLQTRALSEREALHYRRLGED
jgi:hypothetical protein